MNIKKAVITAASPSQRTLPLQTLVDRDGAQKSLLSIIVEEAWRAGIEDICIVVGPGDEAAYAQATAAHAGRLTFVTQREPWGYGHAIYAARDFVAGEAFLHMVGDHVFVSDNAKGCAQQVVEAAKAQDCSVSGVQPTRENLLPYFGTVGGHRIKGSQELYLVEQVAEKPTPTQAEQTLLVPGLRTGHYLCFFGIHALSATAMELLGSLLEKPSDKAVTLSEVLNELARREKYLALEAHGRRYPVDAPYGLLTAQLALALSGRDRDQVLVNMCELLAQTHGGGPETNR